MSVTVKINGTTLIPQPAETVWEFATLGQKMNGTDGLGAYMLHTLKAPVHVGGTSNWDDYDNTVLTSIVTHAPGDTMRGTEITYSSGVVSRPLRAQSAPPGGLVQGVELEILVVV